MTVETNARFINELNDAYPNNRDLIKEGDDHLRLIKSTLKNTFPGIDKAVTANSDKLNQISDMFSFEGDTCTVKTSIEFDEKIGLDMGENQIKNVALPTDENDVVTVAYLQSYNWPIGSIYMTADARNPADIFGFGEWTEFAKGRVIVGSGPIVDASADTQTFVNGSTGGLLNTKITTENLPEHIHGVSAVKVAKGGDHKHDAGFALRDIDACSIYGTIPDAGKQSYEHHKFNTTGRPYTDTHEGHIHTLEGSTDSAGSGTPVANMQPWIVCNIWQRTK